MFIGEQEESMTSICVYDVGTFFIQRVDAGWLPMFKPDDCSDVWRLVFEPVTVDYAIEVVERVSTVVSKSWHNSD